MSPSTVRLRSRNGHLVRCITERQAREMCGEDSFGNRLSELEPVARRLTRKKAPLRDIQMLELVRAHEQDPASLTMSDMLGNVSGVRRAMDKVAAWAFTGDDRAVRVGPLGVMQPA